MNFFDYFRPFLSHTVDLHMNALAPLEKWISSWARIVDDSLHAVEHELRRRKKYIFCFVLSLSFAHSLLSQFHSSPTTAAKWNKTTAESTQMNELVRRSHCYCRYIPNQFPHNAIRSSLWMEMCLKIIPWNTNGKRFNRKANVNNARPRDQRVGSIYSNSVARGQYHECTIAFSCLFITNRYIRFYSLFLTLSWIFVLYI